MHAPEQEKAVPLAHLSAVWPPREPPRPWEIGRGRVWLAGIAMLLFLGFAVPAFFRWPHVISSWGGRYFIHRTVIPVPALQQGDPLWADQLLGNTIETLGQAGCAVTSAAMVMRAYGVDTDPARLNAFLQAHEGYVGDGLLDWDRVGDLTGGQVQKAYEAYASYALLDAQILRGNPVIVRLRLRDGETHFVVVVGKEGWDYLVRDPARPPDHGVYPLCQLTGRIEALRYYTIVPPAAKPRTPPPPAAGTNPVMVSATNAASAAPPVPLLVPANAYPDLGSGTNAAPKHP